MEFLYKCPVCGEITKNFGKSYICSENHTFDVSKEGYVNFAPSKKNSGDSKDMCLARHRFLSHGYYENFAKALSDIIGIVCKNAEFIIDAGCGEGYYIRKIRDAFPDGANFCGIDYAKEAIKIAAKQEKNEKNKISYFVCGIYSLPARDESADCVISVFAPVCGSENLRVLKKGGYMLVAGPGKRHLSGLKSAIYEKPYQNEGKIASYDGFEFCGTENVYYNANITGEDISSLFTMTPYYWKTSREDAEKLASMSVLETELEFVISKYRKI